MQARLVHGEDNVITADFGVSASAYSAGEVVIKNDHACIANRDIAIGDRENLVVRGGIWDFAHDNTSGPTVAIGEDAFWDDSNNVATDVSTGNTHLGWAVNAAGASDALLRIEFNPRGELGTNEST